MAIFSFGKLAKIARETLVFPPPEPPVTPIIIGLFCIISSISCYLIYFTAIHVIMKELK